MRPRSIALLIYLFLVAAPVLAQNQSDSSHSGKIQIPKPHLRVADKKFWTFAAIQLAAATADFETTEAALGHDPRAQEVNPLFGSRPARAKLYGIGMPLTVFQIFLQYRAKEIGQQTGKGRNWWLVGASSVTGFHTFLAIHNAGLADERICPAQGAGCL
jgi:hypothetical protein